MPEVPVPPRFDGRMGSPDADSTRFVALALIFIGRCILYAAVVNKKP